MDEFQKKNGLSPIRTFADDLKAAQGKTSETVTKSEKEENGSDEITENKSESKQTKEENTEAIKKPETDQTEETNATETNKKTLNPIKPKTPNKSASDFLENKKDVKETTDQNIEEKEDNEDKEKKKEPVTIPKTSLEKEINDIATLSGTVRLEDDGVSLIDDDISEGKFVQDRKVRRHKLFPSLAHASKDWAEDKKEAFDELRKPEYTIEDPEKRINTIKEASKNSKRMPQEDFDVVVEKFKNVERKPTESSIRLKDRDEVVIPEPTWSSALEDDETEEKNDAEEISKTPAKPTETESEQVDKKEVEKTATEKPEPEKNTVPEIEPEENKTTTSSPTETTKEDTEIKKPEQVEKATDEKDVEAYVQSSTPQAGTETELPAEAPTPDEARQTQVRDASTTSSNQPSFLSRFSISNIPIYAIVIVIIIACLAGIATSAFFLFGSNNEPEVVSEEPVNVSPFGNNTVNSTFVTNKDALVRTMSTKAMSGEGIRTVRFLNKEGEEVPSLNAGLIILEDSGIRLLERSVDSMTFGFTESDEHFIVITGADFDTAFAGMLAWEETISGDLAPLFGENNKRDFIDTAYGSNNSRTARVLLAQNNEPQMAYIVLSSGTIIISENLVELTKIEAIISQ